MSERHGRVSLSDFEGTPVDPSPEGVLFDTLREFRERELPPSQSLVGSPRDGTNLMPRFGWVMPWGPAGSGKTSVLVDLLFHCCAGVDWLGYHIERPLRIVAIVNEGVPGALQDKLKQKIERWQHPDKLDVVLDGLAIFVAPWGEFSFRDKQLVEYARSFALDHGADYVALDPLHTVATVSAGAPDETEAFKHELRGFGVWDDLGVITAHHSNKAGMISGDWARHADTVFHLTKEPKLPASRFTLDKARPADPDELGVPVLLKWLVETIGYERQELPGEGAKISDDELLDRIKQTLTIAREPLSMSKLKRETKGSDDRISDVALTSLETGAILDISPRKDRYLFVLPERCVELGASVNGDVAQMRLAEPENPGAEGDAGVAGVPVESEPRRPASLSLESAQVDAGVHGAAATTPNPLLGDDS